MASRRENRRVSRVADRGLTVVMVGAVLACAALLAAIAVGHSPLVVRSGSMAPALRSGDLIFVQARPAELVAPGEVVTFLDPSRGDQTVTHRVVDRARDGASVSFTTRGDANATLERWQVAGGEEVRVLTARIRLVGAVVAVLAAPAARALGLLLVVLGVGLWAVRRFWQDAPSSPADQTASARTSG
jgi:signal peptidase I